jgi:hypothetical protein
VIDEPIGAPLSRNLGSLAGSLRARAEEYDHRAQALMETDRPKGAA